MTLLPCPFCGGEASDTGKVTYSESHEAWWSDGTRVTVAHFCNCITCGASNKGLVGWRTREQAADKWNVRAPDMLAVLRTIAADDCVADAPWMTTVRETIVKAQGKS